jgi:predicted TIM-barrel fold metal-dependent hydrolase
MPVDRDVAGLQAWRTGMEALAQRPNVAVKISGLAMLDWQWTTDSLRPFVQQTLEIFGPERCLFASNFPVDRLFGAFARQYSAYESLTATLSVAERVQVFATNAERIYRI